MLYFSKCCFFIMCDYKHNLGVLSMIVLNLFVIAKARVVLHMFLF